MTADKSGPWTIEQAWNAAHEACRALGHPPGTSVELLRLGNNAVFRVTGTSDVLRITRPYPDRMTVDLEVCVAQALKASHVPAITLASVPRSQPLMIGHHLVTVWEWVEPDHDVRVPLGQFGSALREFQKALEPLSADLPAWQPLVEARGRLVAARDRHGRVLPIREMIDLCESLERRYDQLEPALPIGPIHGDAHTGNAIVSQGRTILLDFEHAATGPREWDLVATANSVLRFGLEERWYRKFSESYGYDVREWTGYPVLRSIKDLRMTAWLLQNFEVSPEIAQEVHRRMTSILTDRPTLWQPY